MSDTTCVITGNPVDGIFVYGPFPDHAAAVAHAEAEQAGEDWWVTDLTPGDSTKPSYDELLEMLDNVSASASNMIHLAPEPGRAKLIQEARDLCDELLRPDGGEEEEDDDDAYDENGNLRAGDS